MFTYPENKKILVLSTPATFVSETVLCNLYQVPVNILKMISFLKSRNNHVSYINLHSGDIELTQPDILSSNWKKKPASIEGNAELDMNIGGRSPEWLKNKLNTIDFKPDYLWISCSFSFDYDLVEEYLTIIKERFPYIKVVLGGDFVRSAPFLGKKLKADYTFTGRIVEADTMKPDFSVSDYWSYGLFSLHIGCKYNCSFCNISKDSPVSFNVDDVISYMREFYHTYKPKKFWNWDPNILIFPENFELFLDKYFKYFNDTPVSFGKGFQSNLIQKINLKKYDKDSIKLLSTTIPIESSDINSYTKMKKPYSVISMIKSTNYLMSFNFDLSKSHGTFLLGYPDDNLGSIFRAFLISLKMGIQPTPFPVFLFPNTPDFKKYGKLIKGKDLSLLHGELFPLIPYKELNKYINLLKFLKSNNFVEVKNNLNLLTPELKGIFYDEIKNIDRFIENCLNAKNDNIEELKKIEDSIKSKKLNRKSKQLLVINSNARLSDSSGKKLMDYFISLYSKKNKHSVIKKINLINENLRFMDEEMIDFIYKRNKKLSKKNKEIFDYINKNIEIINASTDVLFLVPMYTLNIPSLLKCYLEQIASLSWYYYDKRMFDEKNVYIIVTRGGNYPQDGIPYQKGYPFINSQDITLTAIMDFLGLSKKPLFITAERLDNPNEINSSISNAMKIISKIIKV